MRWVGGSFLLCAPAVGFMRLATCGRDRSMAMRAGADALRLLVVDIPVTQEQTFSNLQKVIAASTFAKEARRVLVIPKGFQRFNMSALVRTTTAAEVDDVLRKHPVVPCIALPCSEDAIVVRVSDMLLWSLVNSVEPAAKFGHVAYSASWVARAHKRRSEIGLPARYSSLHLRLERAGAAGATGFDVDSVRQRVRAALASSNLRALFVASDSEPGALTSKTMECGATEAEAKRCRLRSDAEALHVKLLGGLRADGITVHTLSSAGSRLDRAERSIVDHILCAEAELFLRPCAFCHDLGRTGFYQAWIQQRRAVIGRPTIDISYGPSNSSQAKFMSSTGIVAGARRNRWMNWATQAQLKKLSQSR